MKHVRQQIRDVVVAEELAAFAAAGYLVTARHVSSLSPAELPALLVSTATPGEQSEPVTMGMGGITTLERTTTLAITGIVRENEPDLDDKLEEIAVGVETSVTQTHGGRAKSTTLVSTAKEFDAIGEEPAAAIIMQFAVTYHTASNDPTTPL